MKVLSASKEFNRPVLELARKWGFEVVEQVPEEAYLLLDDAGLWLKRGGISPLSLQVDFVTGALAHRRAQGGNRSSGLGKAIGLKKSSAPHVLDATAGLVRDAFILASEGCRVVALERKPAIVALVEDALARASGRDGAGLQEVLSRLDVVFADAISWMNKADTQFDVVYLDPMFPPRRKSASVKKEMQLLQELHANEWHSEKDRMAEESDLLEQALSSALYRVVVKRPRLAPPLAGKSPTFEFSGKSSRYDVYALKSFATSRATDN